MLGIFSLVSAGFLFSLFGVFARIISSEMGFLFQLVVRVTLMSVIFFIIGIAGNSLRRVKYPDNGLLLIRGVLIVFDFLSIYYAYTKLPLGMVMFLFYAAMVCINYIFGYFFLGEKLNRIKIISLVLAVAGLIVIYKDSFYNFQFIPSLLAVIAGMSFGLSSAVSKKLSGRYSLGQINLFGYLSAAVIGLAILLAVKEPVNTQASILSWIALLVFILLNILTSFLTLYGFKYIEAQKASLILLSELIFVVLVGFLLYGEIPSISTLAGGVSILAALMLPNLNLRFLKKTK